MEKSETVLVAEIVKNSKFQSDKQILEFENKINDVNRCLSANTFDNEKIDSITMDVSNKHLFQTVFNK